MNLNIHSINQEIIMKFTSIEKYTKYVAQQALNYVWVTFNNLAPKREGSTRIPNA